MALCDFLIEQDIVGYDCDNPPVKGVEAMGLLINRADIEEYTDSGFQRTITLKCGAKKAYKVTLNGKTPWSGTQQEMVEGTNQNTITNTLQFVILKQDVASAEQIFALANGEFVAVLQNKNGTYQVYGYEAGLHCSAAVRELYNDDTLSGWLITMTEEGAVKGNLFTNKASFDNLLQTGSCE